MARGNNNKNRKIRGKEKTEINFIEREEERLATFSKEKDEIFNKANELAIMTGAQVAIMISSPTEGGKPHSFGHPSYDAIVKRFGQEKARDVAGLVMEAKRTSDINDQNNEVDTMLAKVEQDEEITKKLEEGNDSESGEAVEAWWTTPIEQLNEEDRVAAMNVYSELLEEVYSKFLEKTRNNSGAAAASSSSGSSNVPPPLRVPAELIPRFPTPPEYK